VIAQAQQREPVGNGIHRQPARGHVAEYLPPGDGCFPADRDCDGPVGEELWSTFTERGIVFGSHTAMLTAVMQGQPRREPEPLLPYSTTRNCGASIRASWGGRK